MDDIINVSKENLGINEFLEFSESYISKNFPNIKLNNFFDKTVNGEVELDFLGTGLLDIFGNEILGIVRILISVLIIIIVHSIFKIILENLEKSSSVKIVSFIQYLIIVSIVLDLFIQITDELIGVLDNIVTFMNMFIPFFSMLIISTGNIVTSSVVQGVLFFSILFISNFIKSFLIPMFMISITLSVVSNFSDKIKLEKLSKFFKSTIIWVLGIVLSIFICILSLETEITSSVDNFTSKTTKAAVSNFIPVVGKIMGDSVDAVLGSINILKNSVGIIGILVVLSQSLFPIIKLFIMYVLFNLTSAFSELVAEEKIVLLVSNLSDNLKVLLGIFISVSIMLVIEIVIVIKITSGSVM